MIPSGYTSPFGLYRKQGEKMLKSLIKNTRKNVTLKFLNIGGFHTIISYSKLENDDLMVECNTIQHKLINDGGNGFYIKKCDKYGRSPKSPFRKFQEVGDEYGFEAELIKKFPNYIFTQLKNDSLSGLACRYENEHPFFQHTELWYGKIKLSGRDEVILGWINGESKV